MPKGNAFKRGGKGRAKGLAGAAASLLGGGKGARAGMTGGLYRVNSRTGEITKVSQKRRKKTVRMPRYVAEMLQAQRRMVEKLGDAAVLSAMERSR